MGAELKRRLKRPARTSVGQARVHHYRRPNTCKSCAGAFAEEGVYPPMFLVGLCRLKPNLNPIHDQTWLFRCPQTGKEGGGGVKEPPQVNIFDNSQLIPSLFFLSNYMTS